MLYQAGVMTEAEAKNYDKYFKDKAEDHGLDPEDIDQASDEKKKDFYADVDKDWEAKNESEEPASDEDTEELDEERRPKEFYGDEAPESDGPVEVYGVMGMKSKPFRKKFKSQQDLEKWMDKNEGNFEIQGYR